jgi:hypothetical protein
MDPERPSSNQVSSNRGYLSQIFSKKYNARKIFDEVTFANFSFLSLAGYEIVLKFICDWAIIKNNMIKFAPFHLET